MIPKTPKVASTERTQLEELENYAMFADVVAQCKGNRENLVDLGGRCASLEHQVETIKLVSDHNARNVGNLANLAKFNAIASYRRVAHSFALGQHLFAWKLPSILVGDLWW